MSHEVLADEGGKAPPEGQRVYAADYPSGRPASSQKVVRHLGGRVMLQKQLWMSKDVNSGVPPPSHRWVSASGFGRVNAGGRMGCRLSSSARFAMNCILVRLLKRTKPEQFGGWS